MGTDGAVKRGGSGQGKSQGPDWGKRSLRSLGKKQIASSIGCGEAKGIVGCDGISTYNVS
jgi:hypothetical protein